MAAAFAFPHKINNLGLRILKTYIMKNVAVMLGLLLSTASFTSPFSSGTTGFDQPGLNILSSPACSAAAVYADPSSEARQVAAFNALEVSRGVAVYLSYGPRSLRVEADEAVLKHVSTTVEHGTLKISIDDEIQKTRDVKVYVSVQSLNSISGHSAASITFKDQFEAKDFDIDLSGASRAKVHIACTGSLHVHCSSASTLKVEGRARNTEIHLSGASELDAKNLATQNASLKVSGASTASLDVDGELEVEASGASQVSYSGKARLVKKELSGMSSVKAKG